VQESDESDALKGFDKLDYRKPFIRVYSPLKKGSKKSKRGIRVLIFIHSTPREGSKILRLIIQTISNLQELQLLKKGNLRKLEISEKKK
jgi:hypothetical protein